MVGGQLNLPHIHNMHLYVPCNLMDLSDRTGRWVQETRKTTLKMDGQHKRKHRFWFGKIKRDSKRQKQIAQAGGEKD